MKALLVFASDMFEVITTEGAVPSNEVLNCAAAVLVLPALSRATFAGTSTVTVPSLVGVMVAV